MEYSIKQLAALSGVSKRTLRYYDQIHLLPPKRLNSAGYRIYGKKQIEQLQKILFFKSFGMSLDEIKEAIEKPAADTNKILIRHYEKLCQQRQELDALLNHLKATISYYKGDDLMNDQEKFGYFKEQKKLENEKLYGEEIRKRYGVNAVGKSIQHWNDLSIQHYEERQQAEADLISGLNQLLTIEPVDLNTSIAKSAFDAHKKWLCLSSGVPYSNTYHRYLADLYVQDSRFSDYYNQKTTKDSAVLLQQLIYQYTTY